MQRTVSIIHPSRWRPEMAMETIKKWLSNADSKIEYLLCLDVSDDVGYMQNIIDLYDLSGFEFGIHKQNNKSAVEAINYGATQATGDILIVVSDDFGCPEHWDTLLLEALKDKDNFCAKTKDGQQDWLMTLPIMDRKYYERFCYIYNPIYSHMYADLEMTCVAHLLGRTINVDLEFHHNHPRYTDQIYDDTYKRARSTWAQGNKTFRERLKDNFGFTPDQIVQQLPLDEIRKQGVPC